MQSPYPRRCETKRWRYRRDLPGCGFSEHERLRGLIPPNVVRVRVVQSPPCFACWTWWHRIHRMELIASMALTGTAAVWRIMEWATENSTDLLVAVAGSLVGILFMYFVVM